MSARGEVNLATRNLVRQALDREVKRRKQARVEYLLYIRFFFLLFRLTLPGQSDKGASCRSVIFANERNLRTNGDSRIEEGANSRRVIVVCAAGLRLREHL